MPTVFCLQFENQGREIKDTEKDINADKML